MVYASSALSPRLAEYDLDRLAEASTHPAIGNLIISVFKRCMIVI